MQSLPFAKQRIILIHQKGVIELLTQFLLEGSKTGEIHHKTAFIEGCGRKPQDETAAVAMNKAAVAWVSPLAMAAGVALKQLAAAEAGGGLKHAVLPETG
tara:strand:- start:128 stop:427 length:300 start_codon:yes stop_codon:yes gene_type:complete